MKGDIKLSGNSGALQAVMIPSGGPVGLPGVQPTDPEGAGQTTLGGAYHRDE